MMRISRFGILAAIVLTLPVAMPAQQRDRLVVLTYNIQIGTGMDKKIDLARTAAVIKRAAPDIVALQEVDRKARRSDGVDQARELARMTGMQMVFGKASFREGVDDDPAEYGVAILTRFPIRRSQNRALPNTRGYELRAVLEALVEWPLRNGSSLPLRFFATHFDNASQADRVASAKMLNELARAGANGPAILAGDFNAAPDSEPVKILSEEWTFAGAPGSMLTYPASEPRRQIDYVSFRPAAQWRVIEAKVVDEPLASDHRPVVVTLEYVPGAR